jgi:hypothetical protein
MLFVLKTTYLIMCQHLPRLGKYSPDLPTFANLFCSDSPDSPTFARLADICQPVLLGLARLADICTSNERVTQIWGEWPLLSLNHKLKFK